MLFAQSSDLTVQFLILAAGLASTSIVLYLVWHFESSWNWLTSLFAESPSAQAENLERSTSFALGASDQRVVTIHLLKKEIVIRVEHDLAAVNDPDGEIVALSQVARDVWGTMTPFATAYLAQRRAKVSELVTSLAKAQMRAGMAETRTAEVQQRLRTVTEDRDRLDKSLDRQMKDEDDNIEQATVNYKARTEVAENERKVADAKIAELLKIITDQKIRIDLLAPAFLRKNARHARWVHHFREAYRQERYSRRYIESQLAIQRNKAIRLEEENQDHLDEQEVWAELLELMGQRIYRQAMLLAKKAERK